MYSLLVVDDEQYAVWGISRGIDWGELQIGEVYEAYDAKQSMDIMAENEVDIVIADIEMPQISGIDLLKWINENSPATITIFLTAHAEFSYAREALELGSFNYALKPVDHDELKKMVSVALENIQRKKKSVAIEELYFQHVKTWESHLPILVENFWDGVLNERRYLTKQRIDNLLRLYGIPLDENSLLFPVLVSMENFKEPIDGKEEEIMTHAVSEYISQRAAESSMGTLVTQDEEIVMVVYSADEEPKSLYGRCEKFCLALVQECEQRFLCTVSFYMGYPTDLFQLAAEYKRLLQQEQNNTNKPGMGVYPADFKTDRAGRLHYLPSVSDWKILLESGNKQEFCGRLEQMFANMKTQNVQTRQSFEEVYDGLCYIYISAARKNGMLQFFEEFDRESHESLKSLAKLQKWAQTEAERYFSLMAVTESIQPPIAKKVEQYVLGHLSEEIGREDIAKTLFLNPAYLSRLFKRETGFSLNDFVSRIKLKQAKSMFDSTSLSVSMVAEKTGYYNFSYFTKQFKKMYGVTPSQYKRDREK